MQDQLTALIAKDLGIDGLPQTEQESLMAQFADVALKAATLSVVGKLAEAKRGEFAKLAEAGDAPTLKAFLDREVPDHETLVKTAVSEEIQKFKAFVAP